MKIFLRILLFILVVAAYTVFCELVLKLSMDATVFFAIAIFLFGAQLAGRFHGYKDESKPIDLNKHYVLIKGLI